MIDLWALTVWVVGLHGLEGNIKLFSQGNFTKSYHLILTNVLFSR